MTGRRDGLWSRLGYYRRMVRGTYLLLRAPRYADPEAVVRRQFNNRASIWLSLVERVVFAKPDNPFHQMFRRAGCTFGDLRAAVERDGLEATLAALHREGVYLAHDEFKGKTPIVRGSLEIDCRTESFLNPVTKGSIEAASSGSRSAGTRTVKSIPSWLYAEAKSWMRIVELGIEDREQSSVKPILPASDGLLGMVLNSRAARRTGRWFSTMSASLDAAHYRFATNSLVTLARLYGERVPYPSCLPPNDYSPVSAWLARRRRENVLSAVSTLPSPAARVAAAALEHGHDIRDTVFCVAGEALTDARRRVIESAGAKVYPSYPISEIGGVGSACRQMTTGNMVHIAEDSVAVISYRRRAPLSDVEVNSLLITTLLEHGAYVLINAEMDDSGVIEETTCDCSYSRMGMRRRIRDIASFGKLTGVGVTLVGTQVVRVLEERLPARFGGCFADYQLVERDGVQTRIELRVSRRVKLKSLDEVKRGFLKELRQFPGGASASRVWRDAAAVEVVHEDPLLNSRGKVLPLYLLATGGPKG